MKKIWAFLKPHFAVPKSDSPTQMLAITVTLWILFATSTFTTAYGLGEYAAQTGGVSVVLVVIIAVLVLLMVSTMFISAHLALRRTPRSASSGFTSSVVRISELPARLLFLTVYACLFYLSVSFSFGYWWKQLEAQGSTNRTAQMQLDRTIKAFNGAVQIAQGGNDQLAKLSSASQLLAKREDRGGGGNTCFDGAGEGGGDRFQMRKSYANNFAGQAYQLDQATTALQLQKNSQIAPAEAIIATARRNKDEASIAKLGDARGMLETAVNALNTRSQTFQSIARDLREQAAPFNKRNGFPGLRSGKPFTCADGQTGAAMIMVAETLEKVRPIATPDFQVFQGAGATQEAIRRFWVQTGFMSDQVDEFGKLQGGLVENDRIALGISLVVDLLIFLLTLGKSILERPPEEGGGFDGGNQLRWTLRNARLRDAAAQLGERASFMFRRYADFSGRLSELYSEVDGREYFIIASVIPRHPAQADYVAVQLFLATLAQRGLVSEQISYPQRKLWIFPNRDAAARAALIARQQQILEQADEADRTPMIDWSEGRLFRWYRIDDRRWQEIADLLDVNQEEIIFHGGSAEQHPVPEGSFRHAIRRWIAAREAARVSGMEHEAAEREASVRDDRAKRAGRQQADDAWIAQRAELAQRSRDAQRAVAEKEIAEHDLARARAADAAGRIRGEADKVTMNAEAYRRREQSTADANEHLKEAEHELEIEKTYAAARKAAAEAEAYRNAQPSEEDGGPHDSNA